jgi:hypothetical protein
MTLDLSANEAYKPPFRLPPTGRMSVWHKARLVAEILHQYPRLLRSLRRDDFPTVLATARAPGCCVEVLEESEHAAAVRLGSIVTQVLNPLPTDNRCLIRSLVLLRLLARRGIGADLIIGVRADDHFAAHAWVEHDMQPLLPVGEFQALTRL